ncbi:lactate dehydrogenase, partial [Vibrio parahaemolyticus]|nr:lactate dehydrogenase [Vibrio parahaemolyticus]
PPAHKTAPLFKLHIAYMSWMRDRWAISSQGESHKGICYLACDKNEPEKWFNVATTRHLQFYQNRFQLLFEIFINEP